MQLLNPPSSGSGKSPKQSLVPSQTTKQQDQPDMFLQLLQGPVMSVCVGSDSSIATYNLPVALFCYHSHFLQQQVSHYQAMRDQTCSNKKRKLSHELDTMTLQVKAEESERPVEPVSLNDSLYDKGEAMVKLPDVDPFIFGLFLKYVYNGYYAAAVDARSETPPSVPHTTKSMQSDKPYTPARASMPPPTNINSRPAPPLKPLPHLPLLASNTSTLSLQESSRHFPIPPSVHAYFLSVQLGAPGFLNQAISHIYYGIGKHFALDPSLVHYIWSNTLPHPFCASSPLRKLILDLMVVNWSSTSMDIIAKQPALQRLWNEVLDMHRDLRHEFTMGLQGARKVLPVQSYFVNTCVPYTPAKEEVKGLKAKDPEFQVVENIPKVQLFAAAAATGTTAAKDQDNGKIEEQKK